MGDEISIKEINGGGTPGPGPCLTRETAKSMPIHANSHRGKAQRNRRHPVSLFRECPRMALRHRSNLTHIVQFDLSFTFTAIVDSLPPEFQGSYARDFRLADAAFRAGRLAATSTAREARWRNWITYLAPMGLDPYLQSTTFEQRIRCLTGFAQRVRTGYYGRGRQVQASTVTSAITAVGQTISMAVGNNRQKS